MPSAKVCPNCNSSDIEPEPSRGEVYCTKCGHVIESNMIVSEVQFEEGARGGSHVIGKHVGESGCARPNIGSLFGAARESRQATLDNARQKIKHVAVQLRLNNHCNDTAFNLYKRALQKRLTHGRKNAHVVAACIYITCRTESTHHMLLDLSDVMQVNVYDLGKTYLKLSTALHIRIPAIDPCIYIVRFAAKLDLSDKAHEIEMTAMRIAQRMKRDWMHFGRRPSGLCGAALLVAARLHDVHCSVKEIIKVVKVCEATIRKRLTEFGDTPSSKLTLDDFMSVELEGEEDPPCFKAARKKVKPSDSLQDKINDEVTKEASTLEQQIEAELEKSRKKTRRNPYAKFFSPDTPSEQTEMNELENLNETLTQEIMLGTSLSSLMNPGDQTDTEEGENENENDMRHWASASVLKIGAPLFNLDNNETETLTEEESKNDTKDECKSANGEDGELQFDDLDDDEIDSYILDDQQADLKRKVWEECNADWIAEMKEKKLKQTAEEEAIKEKGEVVPKKKRRTTKRNQVQAASAGEAITKMLQDKHISAKINYDVLRQLK